MAFLLTVSPTLSSRRSASLPVTLAGVRSTRHRWLSVPPETRRRPPATSPSPSAAAFSTTWSIYAWNSGCSASPNATALPAITCMSGPPCVPGNTALSMARASSPSFVRMRPPRGPRSVLWVVEVTTSAWGKGLGCAPVATRPAICAISTMSLAPTPCAIAANRSKSIVRG